MFGLHLQTADSSWQFDVFAFAEATRGHTLSVLFFYLVKLSGVLDSMYLDEGKLCIFLQKMDHGYDPLTPYHNRWKSGDRPSTDSWPRCQAAVCFAVSTQCADLWRKLLLLTPQFDCPCF